ncbi:GNAT family N-acetyltransferase [Streptomyces sp. NRRL B-2790]|uniref:GNAT family N-acetyltransferase n=2 Tax=unclassified Streptomyces TaxID=2593676 RepID=UPI00356A7E85
MSHVTRCSEYEAVARLWQEHRRAIFPAGVRGADRSGIDMVLLDAETAGCVSTWLGNDGSLGVRGHRILLHCTARLDQILPVLNESPGDRLLAARGFRKALTLRYSRLSLADVDATVLTEIIERPHPGYRLVSWQGTVPDGLAQTFAASRRAMDDMPMDDTDYGIVTWDVDRVRAAAKAVEQRGDHLHTVVAIDTSNESIAGFTELVIPGNGTGDGQHYGTGVLPEHRGHGLGRWMKAESIRQALGHYPDLGGLLTDTADSNTHMRHINDGLGYTPTHTTHQHQLDLQQRTDGPERGITPPGPSMLSIHALEDAP